MSEPNVLVSDCCHRCVFSAKRPSTRRISMSLSIAHTPVMLVTALVSEFAHYARHGDGAIRSTVPSNICEPPILVGAHTNPPDVGGLTNDAIGMWHAATGNARCARSRARNTSGHPELEHPSPRSTEAQI